MTVDQDLIVKSFALFGAGYLTYMVARHGITWVAGKIGTWFTAGKADLTALEARVSALESGTTSASTVASTAASTPKASAVVSHAATGPTGTSASEAALSKQIASMQARLAALEAAQTTPVLVGATGPAA